MDIKDSECDSKTSDEDSRQDGTCLGITSGELQMAQGLSDSSRISSV